MKISIKKPATRLAAKPGYSYSVDRDGISQGSLATYLECRERARLSQLLGWTSGNVGLPLVLGSIGHEYLDWWHKNLGLDHAKQEAAINHGYDVVVGEIPEKQKTTQFKDDLLEDFAIIKPLLHAYSHQYRKIDTAVEWVGSEDEFRFMVDGTPVRGKIDGAFRPGKGKSVRLLESKFKARWSEDAMTDWLPLDLQTGMYITATKHDPALRDRLKLRKGEAVKMFRYDVIRKPQLRRKKEERITDFADRVKEDLRLRPEHYFHRWDVELTEKDLSRHEERIFKLVREYRLWALWHTEAGRNEKEPVWTSAACEGRFSVCPYLAVCARDDYGSLRKRDRPFPELSAPKPA